MSHELVAAGPSSVLVTASWWRGLANKLGRQFTQVVLPILAALTADPSGASLRDVGVATGGALAVTLIKAGLQELTGLKPTEGSAQVWQILDRTVPAFAGVVLGLWPATAEGLLAFDLREAVVAGVAAALAAALAYVVAPPVLVGDGGVADPDVTGEGVPAPGVVGESGGVTDLPEGVDNRTPAGGVNLDGLDPDVE